MSDNRFDIAIVGAGPAGSMAALSASKLNKKVALFERKKDVGIPVRCGEGIGYKGLVSYLEPHKSWLKSMIKKSVMISPDGTRVEIANVEESYILDREKMDADIVTLAVNSGVAFYPSTNITSIEKCNDSSYLLKSPSNSYSASIVIIADGVESKLARDLGWNTCLRLEDIETCAFARVVSPFIDKETCVFYTGSNVAPGGYVWVFPRGVGEANVGLGISGKQSQPGRAKELLYAFINKEFPSSRVYNFHCGGVPATKWIRPLVKDGALLVGDAARQVNALSGAGISYSLFAGQTAGVIAAKAITNGSVSYSQLLQYETVWKKRFGKQQERSFALKEYLAKNSNDQFLNKIALSLSKENPAKINYLRVFVRTFSKNPILMFKAIKLFK
jgi:digeranylgeranylglycerophospholipid reductase